MTPLRRFSGRLSGTRSSRNDVEALLDLQLSPDLPRRRCRPSCSRTRTPPKRRSSACDDFYEDLGMDRLETRYVASHRVSHDFVLVDVVWRLRRQRRMTDQRSAIDLRRCRHAVDHTKIVAVFLHEDVHASATATHKRGAACDQKLCLRRGPALARLACVIADRPSMKLVIGNKTYSSWSMRPWIAAKAAGIRLQEEIVWLRQPDTAGSDPGHSPNGKVPALIDGDVVVFESIAILEHLAERAPMLVARPACRPGRMPARSAPRCMPASPRCATAAR